ncbi:hypothetical protein N0V88_001852 [Collariella sp. IMI 366227]|nr:hypothetical protein N0V88_001852 [Collariella sp. IMI 366227]
MAAEDRRSREHHTCPFSRYIYNLISDAATLRHATLSVLQDFAADGVVYLELRTTPRAMFAAGLTETDYVQTILDAIAEYETSQADCPEPKLRTKLILSTDDVGVFGSPLSNEYALVAQHFGLSRAEICALVRRGVDVIFGGEEEKERLRRILWTE